MPFIKTKNNLPALGCDLKLAEVFGVVEFSYGVFCNSILHFLKYTPCNSVDPEMELSIL